MNSNSTSEEEVQKIQNTTHKCKQHQPERETIEKLLLVFTTFRQVLFKGRKDEKTQILLWDRPKNLTCMDMLVQRAGRKRCDKERERKWASVF